MPICLLLSYNKFTVIKIKQCRLVISFVLFVHEFNVMLMKRTDVLDEQNYQT